MPRQHLRLVSLLLVLPWLGGAWMARAQDGEAGSLPTLPSLPEGVVDATVLTLQAPARTVELTRRMRTALGTEQEWLAGYVRQQARPDEPLPWHEKFGLTEDEYHELLSLAQALRLQPAGTAPLGITRDGQRTAFAGGDGPFASLTGVVLERGMKLDGSRLTTPFGTCEAFVPVVPDEGTMAATGSWSGASCRVVAGDPSTDATSIVFSLGRFVDGDAIFLRYEGKRVAAGELVERVDLTLSVP